MADTAPRKQFSPPMLALGGLLVALALFAAFVGYSHWRAKRAHDQSCAEQAAAIQLNAEGKAPLPANVDRVAFEHLCRDWMYGH